MGNITINTTLEEVPIVMIGEVSYWESVSRCTGSFEEAVGLGVTPDYWK